MRATAGGPLQREKADDRGFGSIRRPHRHELTPLCIAVAGILTVVGARRLGSCEFVVGIILGRAAAIAPVAIRWRTTMLISDTVAFWLATAGLCAVLLGMRGAGIVLITPAALHWILWPSLWAAARNLPFWGQVALVPLVILMIVFAALRLLQRIVELAFGREAAGFMAGTYLVRIFDSFGRGLVRLLAIPFARRPRIRRPNHRSRW